jgi:amino acid transporter
MLLTFFAFCFVLQFAIIAAFVLGFFFTEKTKPVINVKPFNCRPCLTFWFSLGFGALTVYLFTRYFGVPPTLTYMFIASAIVVLASYINYLTAKLNTKVVP